MAAATQATQTRTPPHIIRALRLMSPPLIPPLGGGGALSSSSWEDAAEAGTGGVRTVAGELSRGIMLFSSNGIGGGGVDSVGG